MTTSSKSNSKPKVAVKNPRKKLTIDEQKAKLALAKAKIVAQESRLAVNDLREYITALKVPTIGSLFTAAMTNRKDVKKIDVLRTLAEIGGLKVTITEKVKVPRQSKQAATN
jgi:hypothetical protein